MNILIEDLVRQIVREEIAKINPHAEYKSPEALRIEKGFSVTTLGDAAGVAPSSITRLEEGHITKPRPCTIDAIADALAVPREEYRAAIARVIQAARNGAAK